MRERVLSRSIGSATRSSSRRGDALRGTPPSLRRQVPLDAVRPRHRSRGAAWANRGSEESPGPGPCRRGSDDDDGVQVRVVIDRLLEQQVHLVKTEPADTVVQHRVLVGKLRCCEQALPALLFGGHARRVGIAVEQNGTFPLDAGSRAVVVRTRLDALVQQPVIGSCRAASRSVGPANVYLSFQ